MIEQQQKKGDDNDDGISTQNIAHSTRLIVRYENERKKLEKEKLEKLEKQR